MIEVELTDAARDDLLRLRDHLRARHGQPLAGEFAELEDDAVLVAVQRGAIDALAGLRDNPWAGAENRARAGSRHKARLDWLLGLPSPLKPLSARVSSTEARTSTNASGSRREA